MIILFNSFYISECRQVFIFISFIFIRIYIVLDINKCFSQCNNFKNLEPLVNFLLFIHPVKKGLILDHLLQNKDTIVGYKFSLKCQENICILHHIKVTINLLQGRLGLNVTEFKLIFNNLRTILVKIMQSKLSYLTPIFGFFHYQILWHKCIFTIMRISGTM